MATIQVYDVSFDVTDDGIEQLSPEEIKELENEIDGKIFEIECHGDVDIFEFEHLICEEITSETGWLVNTFSYRHVVIGEK